MKSKTKEKISPVLCANAKYKVLKLSRKSAMSIMCTMCMGFEGRALDCTSWSCPLYPWRCNNQSVLKGDLTEAEAKERRTV